MGRDLLDIGQSQVLRLRIPEKHNKCSAKDIVYIYIYIILYYPILYYITVIRIKLCYGSCNRWQLQHDTFIPSCDFLDLRTSNVDTTSAWLNS
jgi:hypothetical protein